MTPGQSPGTTGRRGSDPEDSGKDKEGVVTPDGRYLVVRGRLWRRSDPRLSEEDRTRLTRELMAARRAKGAAMRAGDAAAREAARRCVDAAKHGLGERSAVWWTDGAPDLNRHMAKNTVYAAWFGAIKAERSQEQGSH